MAAFGRQYEVELAGGDRLLCFPRGKKSVFACGDRVTVDRKADGQGVIAALAPRRSLLYRSDAYREKLIAANASQVLVVTATEPSFSDELVSRCAAAAEAQHLSFIILLNKIDLPAGLARAREQLALFREAGYGVVELSAKGDLAPLLPRLQGHTSVLVGQSGMGKSTLINRLVPDAGASTGEISAALDSGKHTTTHARLYRLDGESALIDSPGLQTFGLAHLTLGDLELAFVELRPWLGRCRFRDCRHEQEPDCAIRAAVEQGTIPARRYEHFRMLRDELAYAAAVNQVSPRKANFKTRMDVE